MHPLRSIESTENLRRRYNGIAVMNVVKAAMEDILMQPSTTGVYQHDNKSEYLGDHAVRVIGYGIEDNKYPWLVINHGTTTGETTACSR
nr:unnamed protein product [Callosobruchus analis]